MYFISLGSSRVEEGCEARSMDGWIHRYRMEGKEKGKGRN